MRWNMNLAKIHHNGWNGTIFLAFKCQFRSNRKETKTITFSASKRCGNERFNNFYLNVIFKWLHSSIENKNQGVQHLCILIMWRFRLLLDGKPIPHKKPVSPHLKQVVKVDYCICFQFECYQILFFSHFDVFPFAIVFSFIRGIGIGLKLYRLLQFLAGYILQRFRLKY